MTSFEHLLLEGHGAAHGGHEVGQLVVALLERHVDVGPGTLAAPLEGDDVVVGDDDEEDDEHERKDQPDCQR